MEKNVFTAHREINPLTMAIISSVDQEGNRISYILEENAEYVSKNPPSKIIDAACMFFGSSLRGRQEGTRQISGLTHKAPISIDPGSGMYFFPTFSPMSPKCSWLSHSHIEKTWPLEDGKSKILFTNGKSIILDVSYGSLINQINRTAQFRFMLDKRIQSLKSEMLAERVDPSNYETNFVVTSDGHAAHQKRQVPEINIRG